MAAAWRTERRFEMTITRADFLRLLPAALADSEWGGESDRFHGAWGAVTWSLRIEEREDRRIAALRLPVLDVRLEMAGADALECERFVERFLRAYQRAGG